MSSELRVDRILPVDGAPTGGGGSIIQVKTATFTAIFSTSSSTMVDTGLSVSITPKFSTSKILVNVSLGSFANSGRYKRALMNIVRDSTNILVGDARTGHEVTACVAPRAADDNYAQIPLNFMILDSPTTTSAVTYKIQASRGSDTGTVYLNGNAGADAYSGNTASTITVFEVSA
tara:strand:+ start:23 stop:547 length:525 start_codon:yes stop_codon:yes gene_type:complete